MNQKILSKVLATTLAVILTLTNFVMLGVYTTKSYATVDALENQSTVVDNANVKFDAYFAKEEGKRTHTIKQDIGTTTNLYLEVNVEKGYLKNAKIEMLGENNTLANFKIQNSEEKFEVVEKIDTNNNTIALKQINSGTGIVLEVPIANRNDDTFDLSNFNKLNNITLTGQYVDNNGKQIKIEKTISVRNEWQKEVTAVIEQETKTFLPYELKEEKGTILQTTIKTGLENNALPIKQTKIEVKVPELTGVKPEEINVTTKGTYATNNKEAKSFNKDNWAYDEKTGIITITVENAPDENNKVEWNKTGKDEYIITYIYKEKLEEITSEQKTAVTIEAYNNITTQLKQENTLKIEEKQNKGNIVTNEIIANDTLSKGYLYTNSEKELEYNQTVKLDISYAKLIDKLTVESNIDNFINSKGEASPTTISNINYVYYKATYINKESFEKILGTEGYIKIIGKDGEQLAIFTKDTTPNDDGNYVYEYTSQTNQIKIETSKPILEGTLEIKHIKSLKGKTDYSKAQLADFQKLQLKTITNVEYAGIKAQTQETTKDITLIAPSTKIEATVNNSNLSTVVKNENVEFRVALKTNDISCDLYKNPTIEIILPSYIKELKIKDINLLFDDELTIKTKKTYVNDNGNIVIQVVLAGEQITYSQNEVSKGANLVINTDITLKKLTPTTEGVMKVYVTNEIATTYENTEITKTRAVNEKGYAETSLKAVAPTGIVTTNTISGYNKNNETVTSISGEAEVGKLDAKSERKVATISMDIINNYNNKINNISILGRFPSEGNKDIETNKELGSNFSTSIEKLIEVKNENVNYSIYYSKNPEATKDITNESNGWKKITEIENLTSLKSYLVVLNDYEMDTGKTLSLEYSVSIPENLDYGKSVYTNYAVYFDNLKEKETIKDKAIATKIGLSTKEGPNLELAIKTDRAEQVEEGSIITYTVAVKNNGKEVAKNVTITGNVPEGTTYIYYEGMEGTEDPVTKIQDANKKEYSEMVGEIKPGEVKTITYQVEANSLYKETSKIIQAQGTAKVENYEAIFTSLKSESKIVEGYLNIEMEMQPSYKEKKEGQNVTYVTKISNVNMNEKKEVVVTNTLPEGVSFISATNNGVYNEQTNTVTWNLETITGKTTKFVTLTVKINELQNGQTRKEIKNRMAIKTSEKELTTNETSFTVTKPALAITQTTSTSEKVVAGDTIQYNVTIKNLGETDANNIVVTDYMPEGLKYRGATYVVDGKTYESWIGNTDATINISTIKAGESVDITIKALVEDIEENKVERKVVNIVQLTADDVTKLGSNEVTHTIVVKEETKDPSTGEVIEGTYKISGVAWLDSNNDGRRDDTESTLGNIEVMLVNAETGKIVKDDVTGANKVQTTNEQGTYTFANLKPGKYLVVFFYDSENYGVTKYKVDGVIDSKNSDVISMKVTLNGETKLAAVANSIQVVNEDITNIDMGLIKAPKFDLKLDKAVSKITVNNSKGTKTYEYNKAKLAKVDIKDKELEGTTVIIEYKITVTNEGETSGYAKKIVDYLPSDMKFNSELNPDWYLGESGNAYNASLANTLLQPGETKELTLVLTKKMTSDNTGTINNVAEIYEASNDLGLADIDSSTANKVQSEDDISSADAIIGIKTGEVYVYIIITLISITILGVGIYLINKKVLRRI